MVTVVLAAVVAAAANRAAPVVILRLVMLCTVCTQTRDNQLVIASVRQNDSTTSPSPALSP